MSSSRSRQAMTLWELILVIVLLGSGVVAVLYADFLAMRSARETRMRLLVTKAALEYQMEFLLGRGFDELFALGALPVTVPNYLFAPVPTYAGPPMLNPADPNYSQELATAVTGRQYTITAADGLSPVRSILVTVEATWTDPFGRSNRVDRLSTVLQDPTP